MRPDRDATSNPRYFLDTFLEPNYRDWLEDSDAIRLAMNAAVSANQMADWCLIYWSKPDPSKVNGCPVGKPKIYREFLKTNECADFGTIRDVADCHKHLELLNKQAQISSATGVHQASLKYGEGPYGEGKYGGGPQLVIHFDDGTKRAFSAPMKNVFGMWAQLLTRWGI